MFGKLQKIVQKKNASNKEKVSNIEGSEDSQIYNSENNNNNDDDIDIDSESENQNINNSEQSFVEEEEEPSLSDNSVSVIPKRLNIRAVSNVNNDNYFSQSNYFIDSSEISVLIDEIQDRFDIQPNINLPVAVEHSLGAISDRADIGCKSIHSNVEELSALTDEIIQKSNECNHLILRLNEYTVKVSKELRTTQQSIQQIKVPRRSLLQLLMLFFIWIIDLFIGIYHRIESRNRSTNNS